jgi:hypothetical protein
MKPVHYTYLKPIEIHSLSIRVQPIIAEGTPGDALIPAFLPDLKTHTDALSAALGIDRASEFTLRLQTTDGERDTRFVGFRDFIAAQVNHPDETIARAAITIDAILETRGKRLYNYGYAEQSSQLNGLLNDLESPQAQQALETLNAAVWLTPLKEKQSEFESLYQQKIANAATSEAPLVTASKNKVIHYLNGLLFYIDFKAEKEPALFNPMIEKIDEVITDMMSVARARKTRNIVPDQQ